MNLNNVEPIIILALFICAYLSKKSNLECNF